MSQVLRGGAAPSPLSAQSSSDLLDDWVARDAPTLDADNSGQYDDAGPTVMDALWRPIADAVMQPVFGDLTDDLDDIRGLGGLAGESYVDKDLRTLLQRAGEGRVPPPLLRQRLARRVPGVAVGGGRAGRGRAGRRSRARTRPRGAAPRGAPGFTPGLIPDTIRATNRPTFQQVLEFAPPRGRGWDHRW